MRCLWKEEQEMLLQSYDGQQALTLGGDGRHSTVGHSAVYCTYTVQDCSSRKLLNIEQIHVSVLKKYIIVHNSACNYNASTFSYVSCQWNDIAGLRGVSFSH